MGRYMNEGGPVYRAKVITETPSGDLEISYYGPYETAAPAKSAIKRARKDCEYYSLNYRTTRFVEGVVEVSDGWHNLPGSLVHPLPTP